LDDFLSQRDGFFGHGEYLTSIGFIKQFPWCAPCHFVTVVCLYVNIKPQQLSQLSQSRHLIWITYSQCAILQGLSQ